MNNNETVTDIDGNVYNTITIGKQVWMVENLKTTRYNDGTKIPNVQIEASDFIRHLLIHNRLEEPDFISKDVLSSYHLPTWFNLKYGAYCDYDNKPENSEIYGRLYNWYAVESRKLCPKGWHVPSYYEWEALFSHLGPDGIANKLKQLSDLYWESSKTPESNSSGFSAMPGGYRGDFGEFQNIKKWCIWWSSTGSIEMGSAGSEFIIFDSNKVGTGGRRINHGHSVRCIKNS